MNKSIICFFIVSLLSACSSTVLLDNVFSLNEKHRLIKHNFEKKYGTVYLEFKANDKIERVERVTPKESSKPEMISVKKIDLSYIDIDFYNESSVVSNKEDILKTFANDFKRSKFIIVGHSHGTSKSGVEKLAAKRARFISNILFLEGVPRNEILIMSSFSDGDISYSINKGARVIAMPNDNINLSVITGISG